MLPIIFILPVVQLLILVFAATLEMQHIKVRVVDLDNSSASRNIIQKFNASPFYDINGYDYSIDESYHAFYENSADVIIVFPAGLEKDIYRQNDPQVQFLVNAVNGMTAGLVYSYSSQILGSYNKELIPKFLSADLAGNFKQIEIKQRFWYNPGLNYKHFMVPGILVMLVTLIGTFLTAFNIVREKEVGTIEQINVTPIKKFQFMMGKLIPFLLIGLFELALGLVIGKIIFDIPMLGSLLVLFAFAFVYLILVLALGLLLATVSHTLQQVMFMAFFFMIVFVLMSGLFTPIETMPSWAQMINYINPMAYFMKVNRMILLKGSGFMDIWREFAIVGGYGLTILTIAVSKYSKTN